MTAKAAAPEWELREKACAKVWKTLSKINVNDHTEKKNGLTYLSWAWAYQTMMDTFPTFDYAFAPTHYLPDETAMVHCSVWVVVDGVKVEKPMWLPVMNYKNQAIINPNAVDVNNAKMRCLTKAISMLGLGAYIYAGEDLPKDGSTAGAPKQAREAARKAGTDKAAAKKAHGKKKTGHKKASATPPNQDNADEPMQDDDDFEVGAEFEDETGAIECADTIIQFAKANNSSLKSLAVFWKKNQPVLDKLDEEYPEHFERVKAAFTALRKKLQSQSKEK